MKTRFSTLDIIAILPELKSKLCTGWRVNQVYDCDQKTYLFKLNKSIVQMKKDHDPLKVNEETSNKLTLIIESGSRLHTTDSDWPKSHAPSGFASKLRKHLRNKRIDDIRQVGIDRLVDIQFGTNLAANHLIIELYDKGNLILTDHEYRIMALLRWRRVFNKNTQGTKDDTHEEQLQSDVGPSSKHDSENLKVGELYPINLNRTTQELDGMSEEKIYDIIKNAKFYANQGAARKKRNTVKVDISERCIEINMKDLLNPHVVYGSNLLEDKLLKYYSHIDPDIKRCILKVKLDERGNPEKEEALKLAKITRSALDEAEEVMNMVKTRDKSPGYLVQKKQVSAIAQKMSDTKAPTTSTKEVKSDSLVTNIDFFPLLSCAERKIQQEPDDLVYQEFESFDKAVDVYYCNMESQKLDSRAFAAEKEATKKLDNLKKAQDKHLGDLAKAQKDDEEKARLIELNGESVDKALLIIRSMLANQISWTDIWSTIKEAQKMKDPIASLITNVKFDRNQFTMKLSDPYLSADENEADSKKDCGKNRGKGPKEAPFRNVDIDIGLSAYANARSFFGKRRTAVNKEKKTIEVSKKALKNVERKTREMLKEVVVKTNITKARKRFWFENFFWFISSDGLLVVAGRDAEQNEQLVKRYMKKNDIYVHADLHGASSVIIKNETSDPVPPKTLVEAGTMAVCYSSAWDSKIATTSYWVYPNQVSKTAPAGEYLTLGAFIIRGKKNYLPLANLVLGFGFLFRLGDESIDNRVESRKARELEVQAAATDDLKTNVEAEESDQDEQDVLADYDSDSEDTNQNSVSKVGVVKSAIESSDRGSKSDLDTESKTNDDVDRKENNISDSPQIDGDNNDTDDEYDIGPGSNTITEHRLIDTITDTPESNDVLLYAIPMCGPYSALQSFKYKVKVIPGANKRGKAAKACLGLFLHDKRATQRERDLLKALKDQDFARNIPNKVKISAINLKTMIKKRHPKKSEVRLPIS